MIFGMKGFLLGLYQVNHGCKTQYGLICVERSSATNATTHKLSDSANYAYFYVL